MKLKIFSIRDSKVEAFMKPFFAQTTAEGIRIWQNSINGGQSGFNTNPEDYCLFELGSFDPISGKVEALMQPVSLGLATEFIKQPLNISQPSFSQQPNA